VTEAHLAGADGPNLGAHPARGACIWLTGPSGAGKTTVTNALLPLLAAAGRTVTVLDTVPLLAKAPGERGSRGKLLRKAFVSSEIVRHGGIVICVTVSTRRAVRTEARALVGSDRFIEVHFDLPPEVAAARREQRGRQRSMAKRAKRAAARFAGRLSGRARGYEAPLSPEVTIDAASCTAEEGAQLIFEALRVRGIVSP
jgi:sulfate adenylyltransferase